MDRRNTHRLTQVIGALLSFTLLTATFAQESGEGATPLRVGVVLAETGPASALGEGEVNTLRLLEQRYAEQGMAGHPVEFLFIDSASTVAGAVEAVGQLLETGELHALICCTLSSSSQAIVAPAQSANVPTISLAAAAPIARPAAMRRWVFQAAQPDSLMVRSIVEDARQRGITNVAVLALSDEFGESGLLELGLAFEGSGASVDKVVRYERDAESFVAPALAAVLDRPQAVIVWGIAEDSARMVRALRERGFGGDIYLSHGVGAPAFLELAGEAAEGVRMPMGPLLVAQELAGTHPVRESALAYREAYAAEFGEERLTSFGAHLYDAVGLIEGAVAYAAEQGGFDPADLPAARAAIRSALEGMGPYHGAGGVFDYSGTDHQGLDERAVVMVEVREGGWRLGR